MLDLYEEELIPSLSFIVFGQELKVYPFGLYVLAGMVAAVIAMMIVSREMKLKKGTGILLSVAGILCGGIVSRLCFCLMDQFSDRIPFSSWIRLHEGGWSMFGAVAGVFFGAWLTALWTKQKKFPVLDTAACALPLFVAAERAGEYLFDGFNTSRSLSEEWLANSFLAIGSEYESYLRTYYLCAAAAIVLFFILNICRTACRWEAGDAWTVFMILFGAGGIILESLRYDYFLSISFVHIQQILYAAVMLGGLLTAVVRAGKARRFFRVLIPVLWAAMCGLIVWVEFLIDRSDIPDLLLYGIMILLLLMPVIPGLLLIKKKGQTNR